jgi:hypothetical protein
MIRLSNDCGSNLGTFFQQFLLMKFITSDAADGVHLLLLDPLSASIMPVGTSYSDSSLSFVSS